MYRDDDQDNDALRDTDRDGDGPTAQDIYDTESVKRNWEAYRDAVQRGHTDYGEKALRNVDFFFGDGGQWSDEDRDALEDKGILPIELNEIFPAVNTALGHQAHNRMDIHFLPAGAGADDDTAKIINSVVKYISAEQNLPDKEGQVFFDGMVGRRGFFDIRMDWDEAMRGDVVVDVPDPCDIVIDPDASSYEPEEGWGWVARLRWMTEDEITDMYGARAAAGVAYSNDARGRADGFQDEDMVRRMTFGTSLSANGSAGGYRLDGEIKRYRVIDRQHYKVVRTDTLVTPEGDCYPFDRLTEQEVAKLVERGAIRMQRLLKRVRWTVSTEHVLLHDDWSPYSRFTIVPFFPWFYRGKSIGMVDNLISPQQMLNKATTKYVQAISTTANSGWEVEEGSLVNMTAEELEERGADTGLVLEYKKGYTAPNKIQPNQIPTGIDRIIERSEIGITRISGMSDALRGMDDSRELSGIALETKSFLGLTQIGVPLANLRRTRNMLAERLLECIQRYMTDERVLHIASQDEFGRPMTEEVVINQAGAMDAVLNDVTIGKYKVRITDAPHTVTSSQAAFQQAKEMREIGVAIPDKTMIETSTLPNKSEILEALASQQQVDPVEEAKAELIKAQARLVEAQRGKAVAETVNKNVEAMFGAMQTGQTIAAIPQVAPLGDTVLRSSGFEDQDAAPLVPQVPGFATPGTIAPAIEGTPPDTSAAAVAAIQRQTPRSIAEAMPRGRVPAVNTNPTTPANPAVGLHHGIETARLD